MARIQQLQLTQFRNIQQAELTLASGLNVIIGDNAAGKTSVIEALWVLASGRSFRTHKPQQLIQTGQAESTVFCQVERSQQHHKLGLKRTSQGLELRMDGQSLTNQSEMARYLPIQLLTPESHRLLEEGPKARRQFLDWGCFYHHPNFMSAWRHYQRALKQRNQSLKKQLPIQQIQLWDAVLVQTGEQISELRAQYLNQLQPYLVEYLTALMPELKPEFDIKFYPGWPANQPNYQACLQDQVTKDLQIGHTQYGCHRADIKFKIDHQEPLVALSRGQQKLFVCALLLAQAQFHQQSTGDSVIMLIDDLPAELDQTHRQTLLSLLNQLNIQHLVTTTSQDLIPTQQDPEARYFKIEQGQINQV
jgi:DNA replication and repair protein RecF